MKFCTQCGQAATDEHKYCMRCGAAFSETPAAQPPAGPAAPSVVFTAAPPPPGPAKHHNQILWLVVGALALFVVMPILIIVAVAYPNMVRVRSAANESATVRNMRVLNSALSIYQRRYGHYPIALEQLTTTVPGATDSTHAGIVVQMATRPRQRGYDLNYQASRSSDTADLDHYELRADPIEPGKTGVHYFFTDESGVIRWDEHTAGPNSQRLNE